VAAAVRILTQPSSPDALAAAVIANVWDRYDSIGQAQICERYRTDPASLVPVFNQGNIVVTISDVGLFFNAQCPPPNVAPAPAETINDPPDQSIDQMTWREKYNAVYGGCQRGALEDDGVMDTSEAAFCDEYSAGVADSFS
jgi:hypothetical protein